MLKKIEGEEEKEEYRREVISWLCNPWTVSFELTF